jgi:hypothetical protein
MTSSTITKTLKKVSIDDDKYSVGFRRMQALPARVIKNIQLSCIMKGENNTNSVQEVFNNMTEKEFINYLKLA